MKGNDKVNLCVCTFILMSCNCLKSTNDLPEPLEQPISGEDFEEKQYKDWINSLEIEGVVIEDLSEDLKDGIILNKIIHEAIDDTVVDWN